MPCWLPSRLKRNGVDKAKTRVTFDELVKGVKGGSLFGAVECDLHVPTEKQFYFSEMSPIFKNTKVGIDAIGDSMGDFAKENNLLRQPHRNLIGSLKGKQILLTTPLLKWYRDHGLKISRIFRVIEFTPKVVFVILENSFPRPEGMVMETMQHQSPRRDDEAHRQCVVR